MSVHSFRIDPARLPQRLDLEVSEEVHQQLLRLSARTGRSVRDLASDLICRRAAQHHPCR